MKFMVEVNAKWLVNVEADTPLAAEHKVLEYNGIWGALAFDQKSMKTDTFAGAVLWCETVSMNELITMVNEMADAKVVAVAAQIEREDNAKAIAEMEKRLEELRLAQRDLDRKANEARYEFDKAENKLGKQRA